MKTRGQWILRSSRRSPIVRFYALFSRIRLVSSGEVAQAAEKVMEVTIKLYNAPPQRDAAGHLRA